LGKGIEKEREGELPTRIFRGGGGGSARGVLGEKGRKKLLPKLAKKGKKKGYARFVERILGKPCVSNKNFPKSRGGTLGEGKNT